MGEIQKLNKPPVEPIYSQSQVNETIPLGKLRVEFELDGGLQQADATIELTFGRRSDFRILLDESSLSPGIGTQLALDDSWDGKLRLVDIGLTIDAFSVGNHELAPCRSGLSFTRTPSPLVRAVAHLFNFPTFNDQSGGDYILVTGELPCQGGRVIGRTYLRGDGWVVEVSEVESADRLEKELKESGGYAITHTAEIRKDDGAAFSEDELKEFLNTIQKFLTFALGRWVGVSLAVGFDASGSREFEQWGIGISCPDHWNAGLSWFDVRHAEVLGQVFPGFCRLVSRPVWRERLHEVLWWYAAANERGPTITTDMAIVLAQAALELLAWLHCVCDQGMVSKQAFKPNGLRASDKLRMLATSLRIPKEIPQEMDALHKVTPKAFEDCPHAITELRNATVHPDSSRKMPEGAWYQGWRLSMWYLDLVLLSLCEHDGDYANRLIKRWVGNVKPVPWTTR
jgi:hypothetical protein